MTHLGISVCVVSLVALTLLRGCERQGTPKPIGSATNKHVEEIPAPPSRRTADTMIEKMKTPMDDAREVESIIKGTAERTSQQTDQANR